MATEEVPVTKESLEEKVGDLKIEEPEERETVAEELTAPPEYVETKDTTDLKHTTEGEVVEAEVPETVAEELTAPPAEEAPTSTEVVDEKPPSKISSVGDKISDKFHKIVGKD